MSAPQKTQNDLEATADFDLNTAPANKPNLAATAPALDATRAGGPAMSTQASTESDPADGAPVTQKPKPAARSEPVLGDYKLLKKLGQGGMGTVYKALHQNLDREVAIKVLSKELAAKPDFVHRFLREAKVMAKLDHPHILRCFDAGSANGYHYLAIEYVEGGSVQDLLKKHPKLSVGDALRIVLDCAAALEHAHGLGLIHRDIKPDNLLLTKDGVVKLADLGLAKGVDDDLSLTKTGTGAGTPVYMAPEQARNAKHVDHRADIYALGVMLYVFISGQTPFEGETFLELLTNKEKGVFKPLKRVVPEIPAKLDLIVDKLMSKDSKLRYESCAALVADLESLGLANDSLSFFGAAPKPKATRPASRPAQAAQSAAAPPPEPAAEADGPLEADLWYLEVVKDGKRGYRKMRTAEVIMLVKLGKLGDSDNLAKSPKGPFRSLGTFPKFAKLFKAKNAEDIHGGNAKGFREKMAQIEQEAKWHKFNRAIWRFFEKFVGLLGFLAWLGFLAALGYGGYWLWMKYMP